MALKNKDVTDKKNREDLSPDERLLKEAKDRFRLCNDDYSYDTHNEALKDLNFLNGNQWEAQILKDRQTDRRVVITVNRLKAVVDQVKNDMQMNRPTIKIRPMDNVSDSATAEVIEGLVRHIYHDTDVKGAVDTAAKYCVACGLGYIQIRTEYAADNSFDQRIIVERIDNPLSVYFPIPLCKMADYSDAPYAFRRFKMSKDDFRDKYPDAEDCEHWTDQGRGDSNWTEEELVWLAEYYRVEEAPIKIYMLSTGEIVKDEDLPRNELDQVVLPEGIEILKERDSVERKVMCYLLSDHSVLDTKEFPSKYIPIIPVLADELVVDGKKFYISLIRNARDPQKMINYFKSCFVEAIALAPKSPWLVTPQQIEGFSEFWNSVHQKNLAYLPYNHKEGQAPPQRIAAPDVPVAALTAFRDANDDLKAVTGIHDASLGMQGNEKSGVAIMARQRQGDTSNYHFVEALSIAIRHMGRIFVDMIPRVYDTPRAIRILGEDMIDKVVLVNQQHKDDFAEDTLYDLSVGTYDVSVDTGPSYDTKRQETSQTLLQLIQAYPQMAMYCSDILVRNLDFPGSDELSKRLKKTIAPELLVDDSQQGKLDENQMRVIMADLQRLVAKGQKDDSEKAQLVQIIHGLQTQLQSRLQTEILQSQQVRIKADADVARANINQETERIRHEGEMTRHAVDTAVRINTEQNKVNRGMASPAEEQYRPTAPAPAAENLM